MELYLEGVHFWKRADALIQYIDNVVYRPDWGPQLSSYMVEAAWKLGDWQKLETFLESVSLPGGGSVYWTQA